MKTAILLTGALRTICKNMRFIEHHLMQTAGKTVDIFACLQNDKPHVSNERWTEWFTQMFGSNLRKVVWYEPDKMSEFMQVRERLIESNQEIPSNWKKYLQTSGSMIEYFQLYLAYLGMCEYEQKTKIQYDYVIRARTDSIFTHPVDFHWLNWTPDMIRERMNRVQEEMKNANIECTPKECFTRFMCTLLSDDVLGNMKLIHADFVKAPYMLDSPIPITETEIHRFLHFGRYILTLRKNNLYIVRRDLFHVLPAFGFLYGTFHSPQSDDYWFNAEGQFRDACHFADLNIFDYSTDYEDLSIEYADKWREELFFRSDGSFTRNDMLYCVVRK